MRQGRRRALIQMATGAGKTYTACNFIYRLVDQNQKDLIAICPFLIRCCPECGRSAPKAGSSGRRKEHRYPGNALKRYVRPVAEELGILGHSDVKITLNTYCHTEVSEFRGPPHEIASQLLPDVMKPAFRPELCIESVWSR